MRSLREKNILVLIFLSFLFFIPYSICSTQKEEEKPLKGKTYVEGLFEFFKSGKVIELPDFPKTEVFQKFLIEEASYRGINVESLKTKMKERGITSYLLDLLKKGHISPVEYANLLDISWIQAFQMAYSSGAMKLSDEALEILHGKETKLIKRIRNDKKIVVKQIAYKSSVEDIYPLYAEIAYDPSKTSMPVMVVQHGDYPGTRYATIPSIYNLAKKGIFGISVSKRGRDGSAGKGDGFCKEIYDIYDAVEYVKRNYKKYIDPDNINITGASGGGMDTFSAIVRFPDYFRIGAPFVAPPDIDHWFRLLEPTIRYIKELAKLGGQWEGSWSLFSNILNDLGGFPSEVPDKYLVRNCVLGAGNNPYTKIHIFWDEEDGAAPSITERSHAYFEETKKRGFNNVFLHHSKRGDTLRFLHWGVPDNTFVWHYFLPEIISRSHPKPVLADAGTMIVLGFLKTEKFLVWLGEGNDAVAKLHYSLSQFGASFDFKRISKDPEKKGTLTFYNPEHCLYKVLVNDRIVADKISSKEIKIPFDLDASVKITRIY